MQIDKLQIELRPRSHAQALDLGYALLRSHAGAAYMAFAALWAPLIALAAVLSWFFPPYSTVFTIVAWWLRPLIERAPLYVLSRQVFGAAVTWQEAVRAWPRQLGGGTWRLLTWGRPFAAGRSLYQAVWQLEHARGKVARERIRVLVGDRTGAAAYWFGIICAHLEIVLQFGLYALIGHFISGPGTSNPFSVYFSGDFFSAGALAVLTVAVFGAVTTAFAPIYTACGFTLYLNRRAALEAWDLELKLRQIAPPAGAVRKQVAGLAPVAALVLAVLMALPSAPVLAAPTGKCATSEDALPPRSATHSPEQSRVRAQVDSIFAGEDLRGYVCEEGWFPKPSKKPAKEAAKSNANLNDIASILKIMLIAAAIGVVLWLLYRYRDRLPQFGPRPQPLAATQVGGLDIRAESLPDDVPGAVRALWNAGERRPALALLYRATLSHLVSVDGLRLHQGDTEGDCLRLCRQAHAQGRLAAIRLGIATAATTLWLDGAYGNRWPDTAEVMARCDEWAIHFAGAKELAA